MKLSFGVLAALAGVNGKIARDFHVKKFMIFMIFADRALSFIKLF